VLYLFDGYNILHAGEFRDRQELVDRLASFVAERGAHGVVVFDGHGENAAFGSLEVRFASPADPVIERLAAENRAGEEVWVISTDRAIRGTAGQETRRLSSKSFLRELSGDRRERPAGRSRIEDALDAETRDRLERFRRRRR
jgi:predicted RNA-binding protein with PIN domain